MSRVVSTRPNTCSDCNRLTIFMHVPFSEWNAREFIVPSTATCGFYDSAVGSGSRLILRLKRCIKIDLDKELDGDTHSRWQMRLDNQLEYSPRCVYRRNVYGD